jgi:PhnB protein
MATINSYLNFDGNTEEAFTFYKSVFGGEFIMLQRFKDTPDGNKLSTEDGEKVMHVSLAIGKGNILMASDFLESMGHKLVKGNNFSLSLNTESKEEADKLFAKLSDGAKIEMPLSDVFWGGYFGMLIDKFGIKWMVSFEKQ